MKLIFELANKKRFEMGFTAVPHDKIYRLVRLASNMSEVTFLTVRECFVLRAALFLVIPFLLCSCASSDDAVTGGSASQSTGTVPGEKASDETNFAPSGPAGGSVRW